MNTASSEVNGAIIRAISNHAGIPANAVIKQLKAINPHLVATTIDFLIDSGVILAFRKRGESDSRLALPTQMAVRRRATRR